MKKLTLNLLVIFCFIQFEAVAKIISFSNQETDSFTVQDLTSAIESANVGDTIVLMPSSHNYGKIVINKSITLMGKAYDKGGFEKPIAESIYIQAPNVVIQGVECSYIYCFETSHGALLKGNTFKTISFYEPCEDITLLNNTFNILDMPEPVSNFMMANNHIVPQNRDNSKEALTEAR